MKIPLLLELMLFADDSSWVKMENDRYVCAKVDCGPPKIHFIGDCSIENRFLITCSKIKV